MKVIVSSCRNPWLNLALEDSLLAGAAHEECLLLWQSARAIVIGRNQNIWCEVSSRYLRRGVLAVRRESGGGAVYHDRGNLNFALFSPRARYSPDRNFSFLVSVLHALGLPAKRSGTHSIMVRGQKVSGSAFRFGRQAVMHHGTLLVNAHLAHLQRGLRPDNRIVKNNGIHSRRAPVGNLGAIQRSINVVRLRAHLINNLTLWQPATPVEKPLVFNERTLRNDSNLQAHALHLQSWEWRIGRSPTCTITLENRAASHFLYLHITIEWGIITHIELDSPLTEREAVLQILRAALIDHRIDGALRARVDALLPRFTAQIVPDPYPMLIKKLLAQIKDLIIDT